jgi:quercetin 2,3-dioxygenase
MTRSENGLKNMTTYTFHKANTRGHAAHGWLDTYHTFSFASYYDEERVHFGALRVLNDDRIAPATGFGQHPHDNMEIITIPLTGALRHQDSMGHTEVMRPGEIQVMSAGKGIYHSEYNDSDTDDLTLLQIWVIPKTRNVAPRYEQHSYDLNKKRNAFVQLVSPDPDDEGSWIHQDAWFHLGVFDAGAEIAHALRKEGNGLYAFVIQGEAVVAGHALGERDGLGIADAAELLITETSQDAEILLIEVPMMA